MFKALSSEGNQLSAVSPWESIWRSIQIHHGGTECTETDAGLLRVLRVTVVKQSSIACAESNRKPWGTWSVKTTLSGKMESPAQVHRTWANQPIGLSCRDQCKADHRLEESRKNVIATSCRAMARSMRIIGSLNVSALNMPITAQPRAINATT